jgi:hypothetical protein
MDDSDEIGITCGVHLNRPPMDNCDEIGLEWNVVLFSSQSSTGGQLK